MLVERIDKSPLTLRQKLDNKWYEWPNMTPSVLDVPNELAKKLTENVPHCKYFRLATNVERTPLAYYTDLELATELKSRNVIAKAEEVNGGDIDEPTGGYEGGSEGHGLDELPMADSELHELDQSGHSADSAKEPVRRSGRGHYSRRNK